VEALPRREQDLATQSSAGEHRQASKNRGADGKGEMSRNRQAEVKRIAEPGVLG
jgi:hypothetical protein